LGRQLSSSLEAIRNAIESGVSRYQDGNGMGFPSLLHALADLWRTARICSGEAGLLIDRIEDQRKKQICLPAATSWGSYLGAHDRCFLNLVLAEQKSEHAGWRIIYSVN